MKIYVNYNDKRWRKYKINFEKIALAAVMGNRPDSEVSIILTNDKEIHKINREYRNIDKPTNVLSFELGDDILLGDIYISLDTVLKEAKEENISLSDHTAHMVVHGMLHLQGYDHIKEKDAEVMENKETEILKGMNIKNPYASDYNACKNSSCCPGNKFFSWLHSLRIRENSIWQYLIMFLLGAIASLGFAPFHIWWATLVAIAAAYKISICGTNRSSLVKTFLQILPFSAAYAISMFWWVVNSIYVVPELAAQFAVWTLPALIGIGIVGGIIFAIPFVMIRRMCTFPACRAFLFAAIWVLILWLREWLFTGFPWNPLSNILMPFPVLANSMSLWGALGSSFVIIGLLASIAELIGNHKDKTVWGTFCIFIVLSILGVGYGYKNIHSAKNVDVDSPIIRIVQPARSAVQKATHSREEALKNATENVKFLINLASASGNIDLVVFPETSYPFIVLDGDDMPISVALNNNIIIGTNFYSSGNLYNSMIFATPDGEIQKIYSKSHLVPFGEYRPFGDIIPTPGQLSKGNGPELISINVHNKNFTFVPAICYEIIFSDSLVPSGKQPDAVINITNDTWFGNTPGTYQHLDMVRRYAIESGLPIVRANYSGISAFITSYGTIISEIPVGKSGYMDGVIGGAHFTLYREIGRDGWIVIILLFSCICTISLYALKKQR